MNGFLNQFKDIKPQPTPFNNYPNPQSINNPTHTTNISQKKAKKTKKT